MKRAKRDPFFNQKKKKAEEGRAGQGRGEERNGAPIAALSAAGGDASDSDAESAVGSRVAEDHHSEVVVSAAPEQFGSSSAPSGAIGT